jgi:ribose-phosphate pyrophosphokinase
MISLAESPHEKFNFPCGETHIKLINYPGEYPLIRWEYESDSEIMEYLLIVDILRRRNLDFHLFLPYVPFSRQDRVTSFQEPFSLKVFCDLINNSGPKSVTIEDPHSYVTSALLNNVNIVPQESIFRLHLRGRKNFWLVSPDAGALKKTYKLSSYADVNPIGIIECSKNRDIHTGKITSTNVNFRDIYGWPDPGIVKDHDFILVDDICDGGRTFIEISKQLKFWFPENKIILMVTHGFFTKGLEVFDGLIDEIYTRKGRMK